MKEAAIYFNYDCGICGKHTEKKMYPVVYLGEKILVCETCFSFIKDAEENSTFKVVKK